MGQAAVMKVEVGCILPVAVHMDNVFILNLFAFL